MTFPPARPRNPPRLARPLALAVLVALAALQLAAGLGQPGLSPAGELAATTAGAGAAASPVPTASGGSSNTATGESSLGPAGSGRSPAAAASTPTLGPGPSPSSAAVLPFDSPTVLGALDARLAELQAADGIPGISATILFRDGTRWTGVGGLADVGLGIPVRPGTPFALASISKTFTAALILRLVDQGRLTLDEPAAPHLAPAGIKVDGRITIRQLLDHTSGLADFLLNPKIEPAFASRPDSGWTPVQALAFLPKPIAAPGVTFYYSNTNYLLLGLIAEQVTGEPIAVSLHEAFIDPLGLRTTSYQDVEPPLVPVARAYRFDTGSPSEAPILVPTATDVVPFRAVVTAAGAAGSIAASSPDVAAWARALYTGRVLSIATVARMVDDAARTTAVDPERPYGLGVDVFPIDGHLTFGHSGRYLGVRDAVRYLPVEGLTIAVLTNQSRVDPAEIVVELLRVALGEAPAG